MSFLLYLFTLCIFINQNHKKWLTFEKSKIFHNRVIKSILTKTKSKKHWWLENKMLCYVTIAIYIVKNITIKCFVKKFWSLKAEFDFLKLLRAARCSRWLELLLIKVLHVKIIFARTWRLYLQCLTCSNSQ